MDNGNSPPLEQTVQDNKAYNKKVESKTKYALTITYKYLHCRTPRGQFYEVIPYTTKLLQKSTFFELVPEFRITNGSIHCHCIIEIRDRIKWLKQTLPGLKRLGFYLVKPIDNLEKWKKYIEKEVDVIQSIVPYPMPITTEIIIKKEGLKTYSIMDDYIIECLQEAVPIEVDTKSEDEVSVQEEVKDSNDK